MDIGFWRNTPQLCLTASAVSATAEPTILFTWWHYEVIKSKQFPRYWPFVQGIHRSPVNSPHRSQWRGALMFSLICALNKRLIKQSWCWWFKTPSRSLCRHCNGLVVQFCDLFSVDFADCVFAVAIGVKYCAELWKWYRDTHICSRNSSSMSSGGFVQISLFNTVKLSHLRV